MEWQELRETIYPVIRLKEGEVRVVNLKDFGDLIKTYLENPNAVETLRYQLNGKDWRLALEAAFYLDTENKKRLFPEIFYWIKNTKVGGLVRTIINSLPKEWVLPRLETEVEKYLGDSADDYDYRMILNFTFDYAPNLAIRVTERALLHADQDVRDVGEDFKGYLKL